VVVAFDVKSLLVGMFHHHGLTMIVVYAEVLFNPSKPLVTAMAPLFSMMARTVGSRQSR
jgi:hypothetical protein